MAAQDIGADTAFLVHRPSGSVALIVYEFDTIAISSAITTSGSSMKSMRGRIAARSLSAGRDLGRATKHGAEPWFERCFELVQRDQASDIAARGPSGEPRIHLAPRSVLYHKA